MVAKWWFCLDAANSIRTRQIGRWSSESGLKNDQNDRSRATDGWLGRAKLADFGWRLKVDEKASLELRTSTRARFVRAAYQLRPKLPLRSTVWRSGLQRGLNNDRDQDEQNDEPEIGDEKRVCPCWPSRSAENQARLKKGGPCKRAHTTKWPLEIPHFEPKCQNLRLHHLRSVLLLFSISIIVSSIIIIIIITWWIQHFHSWPLCFCILAFINKKRWKLLSFSGLFAIKIDAGRACACWTFILEFILKMW